MTATVTWLSHLSTFAFSPTYKSSSPCIQPAVMFHESGWTAGIIRNSLDTPKTYLPSCKSLLFGLSLSACPNLLSEADPDKLRQLNLYHSSCSLVSPHDLDNPSPAASLFLLSIHDDVTPQASFLEHGGSSKLCGSRSWWHQIQNRGYCGFQINFSFPNKIDNRPWPGWLIWLADWAWLEMLLCISVF